MFWSLRKQSKIIVFITIIIIIDIIIINKQASYVLTVPYMYIFLL